MYSISNSIVNSSSHAVWVAYSVGDKDGDGWDDWRVRALRQGSQSKWVVDLDYMRPKDDSVHIKGLYGWWKLGQGRSYGLFNSDADSNEIIVICFGGLIPLVTELRYYEAWAKAKGQGDKNISAQIQEWENLKDAASPIKAED